TPFFNFHLGAVRDRLRELGWSPRLFASVNNFRRWERAMPRPVWSIVRPVVQTMDVAAQRIGKGGGGPGQFLWLAGPQPLTAPPATGAGQPPEPMARLAPRMWCPACHGDLAWTADMARCTACQMSYGRKGAIWDFVVA